MTCAGSIPARTHTRTQARAFLCRCFASFCSIALHSTAFVARAFLPFLLGAHAFSSCSENRCLSAFLFTIVAHSPTYGSDLFDLLVSADLC
jgi:hypothetical protein